MSNSVFGLAGIALSAVGTTISAPNLLYAGLATVFIAVLIAAYCSFPPKLKSASEFVGRDISIDVLNDIFPPILNSWHHWFNAVRKNYISTASVTARF
ncbi:hypothetical protein HBJ01_00735 [Aeromonas veronii]|uniref:hypothetical protein n=1 Tax=Aeromonas veronii TaxID=654 RepID=UPI00142F4015|nr:hypothetical protein [Aeromonas veronii]NJI32498.1 hypothetical protein [Aeromonas veronii]